MSKIADLVSLTMIRYAHALAIIEAHSADIEAAESLVETLNEAGGLDLSLAAVTHEHYEKDAPASPRCISLNIWLTGYKEAALRRAIAESNLHIADETESISGLGYARTTITLSDLPCVAIMVEHPALRVAA